MKVIKETTTQVAYKIEGDWHSILNINNNVLQCSHYEVLNLIKEDLKSNGIRATLSINVDKENKGGDVIVNSYTSFKHYDLIETSYKWIEKDGIIMLEETVEMYSFYALQSID